MLNELLEVFAFKNIDICCPYLFLNCTCCSGTQAHIALRTSTNVLAFENKYEVIVLLNLKAKKNVYSVFISVHKIMLFC